MNTQMLKSGTLWAKLLTQTQYALQCGALLSIPTEYEFVEHEGVRFLVRIFTNLVRKEAAKKQQDQATQAGKNANPFLPYEEDLFVADLSDTHLCLLNKFNVVDHHLLIITRAFEEQESLLTLADFEAMWMCLSEIDGLAFYNAGKTAGASQRHKHLQLVPLPLSEQERLPIAPCFSSIQPDSVGMSPKLPFVHAIARFPSDIARSPEQAAKVTLNRYYELLEAIGLKPVDKGHGIIQPGAYNLLATREWMMVVPRSHEEFEGISVNSMGFAGALLVRNQSQMDFLKRCGPMTILKAVGVARD